MFGPRASYPRDSFDQVKDWLVVSPKWQAEVISVEIRRLSEAHLVVVALMGDQARIWGMVAQVDRGCEGIRDWEAGGKKAARMPGLERLDVWSMIVVGHSGDFVRTAREFASVVNTLASCRSGCGDILEWEGQRKRLVSLWLGKKC